MAVEMNESHYRRVKEDMQGGMSNSEPSNIAEYACQSAMPLEPVCLPLPYKLI